MGKHKKEEETQRLVTLVPVKSSKTFKVPDADRVARDANIVDKGWNNVPPEDR